MFSRLGGSGFFSMELAEKRKKLKEDINTFLKDDSHTVAHLFSLENQEMQDEIMNQLRWGNESVQEL